jgi:hypothetical protein
MSVTAIKARPTSPVLVAKSIKTDLRVQWHGQWETEFYDGDDNGFPGIELPIGLSAIAESMDRMTLMIDPREPNSSSEAAVRELFARVVGHRGPGNRRWVLHGEASWSTSSHIRWMGAGADSIAFRVGCQALNPDGTIDTSAPTRLFEDAYEFSSSKKGIATYWLCFRLQ